MEEDSGFRQPKIVGRGQSKGVGGKTVSSPIYYIVVIVKKDHLCVAQVNIIGSGRR
jgi:hypothetical protein